MGRLVKWVALLAVIAYPVLLHTFLLKDGIETSRLLLVFMPLLCVAAWVVLRTVGKAWWPLVGLLIGGGVYFFVSGDHGRVGLLAVNGLSHATLNLFLLWLFGRTLLPGREPLITQISRRVNGHLYSEVVGYTRWVTVAWCTYFFLQVLVSLLLYVFASLASWSFFINVLNLPLLVVMFVVEKACRTALFPNHPKTTILKAIEVYSRDFSAPRKADGGY